MAQRRSKKKGCDWKSVCEIARELPGSEEGTSYGTPAFRVRKKLFARQKEDPDLLVVRCELGVRELLMEAKPDVFVLTDHYRDHPFVLVRLSRVHRRDLEQALRESWSAVAPAKLRAELDDRS